MANTPTFDEELKTILRKHYGDAPIAAVASIKQLVKDKVIGKPRSTAKLTTPGVLNARLSQNQLRAEQLAIIDNNNQGASDDR